jgi:hypothetical protein
VSSARRLVNISGTLRAIDWKFSQVKDMGRPVRMEWFTVVTIVEETGTKKKVHGMH